MGNVTSDLIIVVIVFGIMAISRDLISWIFKTSDMVKNQQKLIEQNETIIKLLKGDEKDGKAV